MQPAYLCLFLLPTAYAYAYAYYLLSTTSTLLYYNIVLPTSQNPLTPVPLNL